MLQKEGGFTYNFIGVILDYKAVIQYIGDNIYKCVHFNTKMQEYSRYETQLDHKINNIYTVAILFLFRAWKLQYQPGIQIF